MKINYKVKHFKYLTKENNKIGTQVKIRNTSRYFSYQGISNGKQLIGIIDRVDLTEWNCHVDWPNGQNQFYNYEDLLVYED